jgi:tetratricopeptide (TPR) repeat protein
MKPGLMSWLAAIGPLVVACTHYVGRGSDLYYQGRYIEAAHVLEKSEPRLPGATNLEQATYGLYRGATLLRLGDLEGARRWLEYCQRLQATFPDILRADELELLQETMIALRADLDRRAAAGGY